MGAETEPEAPPGRLRLLGRRRLKVAGTDPAKARSLAQQGFQLQVESSHAQLKFCDDVTPPLTHGGPSPFPTPTQPDAPAQPYGAKKG